MIIKSPARLLSSFMERAGLVDASDDFDAPVPPEITLGEAREARRREDYEKARSILDRAIRSGAWKKTSLWWELVSLMQEPGDYSLVRRLWLDSPIECRENLTLLRAVSRAACISGQHEDARNLLRSAILIAARRRRLLRRVIRKGRRMTNRILSVGGASAPKLAPAPFDELAGEALRDLREATDELGVRAFLISGTLLGYMRERSIIGWDKDIDVGVFSEELPDDAETFFNDHGRFNVRRVDLSSDRLRINHENGVWIDLFPHYLEGDQRWHDGAATRWWNTPFGVETVEFLGVEQYVPEDPERYLDENYGPWRIPDPDFDARIDAPNAEVTDRDHLDTLFYFSLMTAIMKDKLHMKERYIALLGDLGEGDWLDRL